MVSASLTGVNLVLPVGLSSRGGREDQTKPDGADLQAQPRGDGRGSPPPLCWLWKISMCTPTAAVVVQRKRQTREVTGFKCPTKPA